VRQASDNNEEELCATPQRELQMLSIELLKLLFQKNQKSKKAATRVEIEAFVSLFVARVVVCSRDKRHLSSLVFSQKTCTRRVQRVLHLYYRATREKKKKKKIKRAISHRREKIYNNAQRRSSADTVLKETFISNWL
jgi:hypothetical protein